MFRSVILLCTVSIVCAFNNAKVSIKSTSLNAKSKSVPFLDQPKALDGTLPGDAGFDPLGLSSLWADKDWSQQIVPDIWPEAAPRTPIKTIDWFRESEVKHGRIAMLAVLGWVAVDSGLRFPGDAFSAVPSSFAAHDLSVKNGSMGFLLFVVSILELINGAAIYDQAKGSGREPGQFLFDPLGLGKKSKDGYKTNEIKNGRLAMLAFAGIVTQAAVFPEKSFPFL
mmetsp:Transcript_18831/g.17047  ORF Transcript_18831/g.17047 Transcript_18831/m.17047 type:complete len:225 (+) Transcript_18831:65-739(+)|eukprot:CAMPEP_0196761032 /NCGR_PEP_ID=MMETSP1095-20130614/105_1 /TAXON_ID=96789 ORGANISM="Chromulina nebulosa, Strain UTEXLB2642" /NCGR_SAMPLE_ID=MMETSP1095 /ASSEMBLY_ACC=CAM_ASM_000446 /LENGTH=224 /DNA_ID=CAMNT_0042110049 /DNA_START=45 /DNA_END=719 /DNA_ORIENTATION=+